MQVLSFVFFLFFHPCVETRTLAKERPYSLLLKKKTLITKKLSWNYVWLDIKLTVLYFINSYEAHVLNIHTKLYEHNIFFFLPICHLPCFSYILVLAGRPLVVWHLRLILIGDTHECKKDLLSIVCTFVLQSLYFNVYTLFLISAILTAIISKQTPLPHAIIQRKNSYIPKPCAFQVFLSSVVCHQKFVLWILMIQTLKWHFVSF